PICRLLPLWGHVRRVGLDRHLLAADEGLGALRCRGGAQVLSHRVGDELAHGESECGGTLFDLVGVLDGQARSDQTASSLAGTPGPGSVECHARHASAISVMRTGGWAAC